MALRVGVDVGGTNTDAVLLDEGSVRSKLKTPTTEDVTTGITTALSHILKEGKANTSDIAAVMIGTTHFTNAVVERRRLAKVGVLRLCLPATAALPPLVVWPEDLAEVVGTDHVYMVDGGYEFDGREIRPFGRDAVLRALEAMGKDGVESIAVSSVFSPVNPDMELEAGELIRETLPGVSVSLSHEIGRVGLLERENAAILNASLRPLAVSTIEAFRRSISGLGISAPLYLTQNDGTLMSADWAEMYPVATFASGPTNSMRGAAYLSGLTDAMVIDIGGTTSDVGALTRGFPREASIAVDIGGVRTNFRMPDVHSFGLGGGTLVRQDPLSIGPQSVGYRLTKESLVFGGDTLTTTDIAVAAGYADIGDPSLVKHLDRSLVDAAVDRIHEMAEVAVDRMKTTAGDLPVIIVGGGSVLISRPLAGASEMVKPDHFEAANAVGAAIAQISGEVDRVYAMEGQSREEALQTAKNEAIGNAAAAGADPSTIEIVDIEDVPLAYLPGGATRVRVKAVGDLVLA